MGVILVATDGSPAAGAALDFACAMAGKSGDAVLLACAWRGTGIDLDEDPEEAWAAEVLQEAAEAAAARGVEAERVALQGKAAPALCKLAAEREAHLIALGSHRWGPVEGLLFDNVSTGLLAHAPCPVLFVPEPAGGTAG